MRSYIYLYTDDQTFDRQIGEIIANDEPTER